jgi:hypothetical protein
MVAKITKILINQRYIRYKQMKRVMYYRTHRRNIINDELHLIP